jgi:hypothetical protein
MLKSRAVAKVKPSSFCSTVLILGIGKGFLINLLLTSQKLLREGTVLFYFGAIKDADAHSEVVLSLKYPKFAQSLNFVNEDIFVYFWY